MEETEPGPRWYTRPDGVQCEACRCVQKFERKNDRRVKFDMSIYRLSSPPYAHQHPERERKREILAKYQGMYSFLGWALSLFTI